MADGILIPIGVAKRNFMAGLIQAGIEPTFAQRYVDNHVLFESHFYEPYGDVPTHVSFGIHEGYRLRAIDESRSAVSRAQRTELVKDIAPAVIESLPDESVSDNVTVETSIDPADDGDLELFDAWAWESEIEVQFEREPMATSFEDIQAETDIYDLDITDPDSEIDVSSEIDQAEQVSPEDEISVVEETIPFEQLIYQEPGDLDLDFTDNAEDVFIPEHEYDFSDNIDDQISLTGSELDDMQIDAEADFFSTVTRTFAQDDNQPFLAQQAVRLDDNSLDDAVIDFASLNDDTAASLVDLNTSDDLGVPFFAFLDDDQILGQAPFDFTQ